MDHLEGKRPRYGYRPCLKFRRYTKKLNTFKATALIIFCALLVEKAEARRLTFKQLTPSNTEQDFTGPRDLSFFIPNDGQILSPPPTQSLFYALWIEDDKGILTRMKTTIRQWENDRFFVEQWKLEDSHLHAPPTLKKRKKYLTKNMLLYMDKRIGGEIKRASKGSAYYKLGQIKKRLRPQNRIQLSSRYKIKVRAKILRSLIDINIENPYIDESTLRLKMKPLESLINADQESQGQNMVFILKHRFVKNGPRYSSHFEYGNEANWTWEFRRELQEIAPGVLLRLRTGAAVASSDILYQLDF